MDRRRKIILALGCLVSIGAIWYSTRQVQWGEFARALGRFRLVWLVPALAAFYYSMYLRAVRWGMLFRPHFDLKGYRVFRPLMICFAFNSILPARVGEFARAWYVGRRERTGLATALATVFAERIFDAVTLLLLLAGSLALLPPIDPGVTYQWGGHTLSAATLNQLTRGLIGLSLALTVAVGVFMIPAARGLLTGLVHRAPLLPASLKHKFEALVEQFARGFSSLHQPATLLQVVFHSVVLWVLVGVSNLAVARGFGIQMNLMQATALVTLIAIFIFIPAAPGYWGLYEAGTIFSLLVMGVESDPSRALAYGLTIHLVQYVPIVAVGLLFAWQSQVRPAAETAPIDPAGAGPLPSADLKP